MIDHEQVKVTHPYLGEIEVDRGLAPLLELLWSVDIDTDMSCERQAGDWVWLHFPNSFETSKFLNVVVQFDLEDQAEAFPHSMRQRINIPWFPGSWCFDIHPVDLNDFVDGASKEVPDFIVPISVRFPCVDLPQVVRAIQRVAEKGKKPSKAHVESGVSVSESNI